ncbi:MAG: hypothetical protein Crog4KO_19300 [Crocinitomicaceae bacterium]
MTSCKKAVFYSEGSLDFSADTVVFDTVFTTVGSTTQRLKIYNRSNRPLKVDQIELMGGENSPFRINVDGLSGMVFGEQEIEANDSLWIFVEVTLDPNGGNLPLIIEDSIRFQNNGLNQYVVLAAWGQDAYFYNNELINSNTWTNDKPHVIYGAAVVDSAETLTIEAGTDIYLHNNSLLYVYKGSLDIQGTKDFPVTLRGDRLEASYDDVPGQFYGIYFQEALPSSINHCNIKNGIAGIHLFSEDPANTGYTLELNNSTVTNCSRYGLFMFQGAKVRAENCILAKNNIHSFLVLGGGDFNLNHCHILNYGSGDSGGAVGISNSYDNPNTLQTEISDISEGVITNSVIYGNADFEFALDTLNPNQTFNFGFLFRNNLIKSDEQFTDNFFQNNIYNIDPLFISVPDGDYKYPMNSPLHGSADEAWFPLSGTDICNTLRITPVDIGAYELW